MLTANRERFCQNIEVKRMSHYTAYLDAFPTSKKWKRETVDNKAYELLKNGEIMVRCNELRETQNAEIRAEARWTRKDAFDNLQWIIDEAKRTAQSDGLTSPCVTAIINATKELNALFAVYDNDNNDGGALADILEAVKGVDND